jgi:hypothetical protein
MPPHLSLESQLSTVPCSPEESFEQISPKIADLQSLRRSINIVEDRNEVFLIPSADELSDEEYDAVWCNSTDYSQIKTSCLEMRKRIVNGLPEDEMNCYRGLEFIAGSKALRKRRSLNRRRAEIAVFLEQEQQWEEEGISSQEEIASVYNSCTRHCQSEAFRRGILDSEAVNENESNSMDTTLVAITLARLAKTGNPRHTGFHILRG